MRGAVRAGEGEDVMGGPCRVGCDFNCINSRLCRKNVPPIVKFLC